MKSKTLIEKQLKKKTNSELVETIIIAKKHEKWLDIARILSSPNRKIKEINVGDLNKINTDKIIVFPGKILSTGEINNKIKIAGLKFSERAKEKLLNKGCEILTIIEEIKKNPEANNVEIIKSKDLGEIKK